MRLTVPTATFTPEFQYQIKGDGVMGRLLDEDDVLNAVDQRIQELQSHPEFRRKHADIDLYGTKEYIRQIPTAQQWITCSNCARNADNGGLYPDGRTRCPIQEHYALLKDGYCHLAEPWKGEP